MTSAEYVRLLNAKPVKNGWIANRQALPPSEMFGRPLARTPWPSSRPALDVAIEALPVIDDDIAHDSLAHLANAIADLREELASVRATLSVALTHAHAQHLEIMLLRQRLANMRNARRAEPRAV